VVKSWPPDIRDFEPGDYALFETPQGTKELWFRDPFGAVGRCVTHTITQEDDGSITVDPSIAATGANSFHGWLRQGVWTW